MYPNKILLETLESKHSEYVQLLPALQEIDLLVTGGYRLKNAIRHFIPQKAGEEVEVYETRLKKYTYLNILSSNLNEQISKLSNAPLTIDGLEANPSFWALRTDCSKYDLLTLAYFQRSFKRVQTPDSDLENSYEDSPPIPTGLQYVTELEKFEWNEPHGYIVQHMSDSLKAIEDQVRDLVSSGGLSSSNGAVIQSGASKQMDFQKQEIMLRAYGEILIDVYQDVLQLVAKAAGLNGEGISVTGLNSFENDSLDSLIMKVDSVSKVDIAGLKAKLPPTVFDIVYNQLVGMLAGNLSSLQKEQVAKEIALLHSSNQTLDTSIM
ncbi:MAG: hypothetical protein V7L21_08560 [Nostoc sp.]|uniref:hypothetical protein n=1 Tax=Nostoc sp. TaxID=1180 RepID=UPI002FFA608F